MVRWTKDGPWIGGLSGWMVRMDGWMDGWIKELMEGGRDGWIKRKYGMD